MRSLVKRTGLKNPAISRSQVQILSLALILKCRCVGVVEPVRFRLGRRRASKVQILPSAPIIANCGSRRTSSAKNRAPQGFRGANPLFATIILVARVGEWPNPEDLNPSVLGLRWFESGLSHQWLFMESDNQRGLEPCGLGLREFDSPSSHQMPSWGSGLTRQTGNLLNPKG